MAYRPGRRSKRLSLLQVGFHLQHPMRPEALNGTVYHRELVISSTELGDKTHSFNLTSVTQSKKPSLEPPSSRDQNSDPSTTKPE